MRGQLPDKTKLAPKSPGNEEVTPGQNEATP